MTATDTRTGIYEGMFLVNQSAAAAFGECLEHINHLFERADATVVAMKKWDERRLSYEMDKQNAASTSSPTSPARPIWSLTWSATR